MEMVFKSNEFYKIITINFVVIMIKMQTGLCVLTRKRVNEYRGELIGEIGY